MTVDHPSSSGSSPDASVPNPFASVIKELLAKMTAERSNSVGRHLVGITNPAVSPQAFIESAARNSEREGAVLRLLYSDMNNPVMKELVDLINKEKQRVEDALKQ